MTRVKNQRSTEIFVEKNSFLGERSTNLLFVLLSVALIGVFYSTATTSIALVVFCLVSLKWFTWKGLLNLTKDLTLLPLVLVFLSVFLSGSYSDDITSWVIALRVKLPFLILPLTIYFLPRVPESFVFHLHFWLVLLLVLVGLPVVFYAFLNWQDMLDLLSKGQPIPTPIEHVKFSMFVAYGFMTAVVLIASRPKTIQRSQRNILIVGAIFLFLMLHVLAVRTGLLISYVSLFIFGVLQLKRLGRKKIVIFMMVLGLMVPIGLYHTVPSVKHKVGYMIYDWKKMQSGEGQNYSDSERILSYLAGIHLWQKSPLLGVGYGDVRETAHLYYDKEHKRSDLFKLPHSQFLLVLSGSGLIGLFVFLAGFYGPLLSYNGHKTIRLLLSFLYLNYTLSFIVENSLERSMSVAFFLLLATTMIKSGRSQLFSQPGNRNI